MAESARGALEDAGLRIGDVDGLFAAGMDMGPMGVVTLAEHLNLKPDFVDGTNIGGSSFVAHVTHAAAAIHAGLCEVALILYGSTAASRAMAIGTGGRMGFDPAGAFEAPYGLTTVGSYALVARRHMEVYGTTSEQLAEVAVTMRRHASLNPNAKMQKEITVADVLESRVISDPLHLLDCCIISDGGGAVVVTSVERARDLAKPPVVLLGCGEAVAHQETGSPDLLQIAAHQSSARALRMAQVTLSDIVLATIYDSFTITVVATLEVNPDGGGLSSNHPGMRGIFLVIEATRQLRDECGSRQVESAELALVHGTGGVLGSRHSGATLVLGRGT
jgi:acetyl-CoA C-acetyltransferase